MSDYIPAKDEETQRKRFGKVLAKERESKGWTQSDLANQIGFGPQTISNWETGSYYPKKVEYLIKLADILECDVDHLLGRMTERTHDLKTACELTGLSETAITKIRNPKLGHPFAKTLSHMIESERFYNLITAYKIFLEFVSKLDETKPTEPQPWLELSDDAVVLGVDQAVNHFKQEAALAMTHICEEEQYTKLMKADMKKRTANSLKDRASVQGEIRRIENEISSLLESKQFLEEEVLPEL